MSTHFDRRAPLIRGYAVERLLGEGSFGVVWLARSEEDDELVAIKVPRSSRLLEIPALREAFEREVSSAIAAPRHLNVLRAHRAVDATLSDGTKVRALVTEYVAGASGLLEAADRAGLNLEERLRLFMSAARGVAELQRYGCIHTDLKPQNILVGQDGVPRVGDFGGLRILSKSDTAPAQVSLRYAAPEVFDDQPESLDHRTVVYSLGKMLVELLAGTEAAALSAYRSRAEAAAQVRAWRPDRCREALGDGWESVLREIERATDPIRARRHPNAEAFLDALEQASASRPARLLRKCSRLLDEVPRSVRMATTAALLALACVVVAIIGGQALAWHGQQGPDRYPKITAPVSEARASDRVAIVAIRAEEEVLRYSRERGIEGLTESRPTWRALWADLAAELAKARPSVLVFDIVFRRVPDAEQQTVALATTLRRLREEHGLPSVIGISPTWHPNPDDSLLDARLAAAVAPQWAGAVELDTAGCGSQYCIHLALAPTDPVHMAPSLALASVAAYCSRRHGGVIDPRGSQILLDRPKRAITIRGPETGGVIRLERCDTLAMLDRNSVAGAGNQAASLPAGWSRDGVVAATRRFDFPDVKRLRRRTYSPSEALEIVRREPSVFRDRVIVLSNNAPSQVSNLTDSIVCDGEQIPMAYFHAQAIESLLEEIRGAAWSSHPSDGVRFLLLLGLGLAGLAAGWLLGGRTLTTASSAVGDRRQGRWVRERPLTTTVILLLVLAIAALLASAWLRLVTGLLQVELAMTLFLAFATGLLCRLRSRSVNSSPASGPHTRMSTLLTRTSNASLSLLIAVAITASSVLASGVTAGPQRERHDASSADEEPSAEFAAGDQADRSPGAEASSEPIAGVDANGGSAGSTSAALDAGSPGPPQVAASSSALLASLLARTGSFPNRRTTSQWYGKVEGSPPSRRRQSLHAAKVGSAEVDQTSGLIELKPAEAGGATQAYFTTTLGSPMTGPPPGAKLISPISQQKPGGAVAWWFPWVGQGPVQGASEGTQVAIASRAVSPAAEDPADSTVELLRFYLVEPNSGSRLQLFNAATSPPTPLLTVEGMAGTGFTDLVVEVRVLRQGTADPKVAVVDGPRAVSKDPADEYRRELEELKQFAISNGLRVPDV